jgi:hypothetical protein
VRDFRPESANSDADIQLVYFPEACWGAFTEWAFWNPLGSNYILLSCETND